MSVRALSRLTICVLLSAGLAGAQHIADRSPLNRCSDLPSSVSDPCLPEAPSAVNRPDRYTSVEATAPSTARKLSPSERPYVPLSAKQKFSRFSHSLYSPYTLFNGAYDATWAQANGDNYAYGGGMQGWGKRLGAAYATTASHQFFGTFLFPTLLRQDPRYFAMYHGSVWKRFVHAVSRTALTKADSGETQIDVSGFLAMAASETIQNTWLPPGQRSLDKTLNRMLGSVQGTATSYVLREFTPDIVRIFKRHSPKALRRLEDKIPESVITGVPSGDE
jgi:hypothetical protein